MANFGTIVATATGPVGLVKTFASIPPNCCVVVVVFAATAGMTPAQGVTGDVVDSRSSPYACLQQGNDLASTMGIFVTTNLSAGALTVTCTVGSATDIEAYAILPNVSPYYICPGSSEADAPNAISNANTAFRGLGGTPFTTLLPAMVIWARDISAGVGPPTTAPPTPTTGTVLFSADLSAHAGVSFGAATGVDNVASIPVSYGNEISWPIFGDAGAGICVFLNNNNASCQFSVMGVVPLPNPIVNAGGGGGGGGIGGPNKGGNPCKAPVFAVNLKKIRGLSGMQDVAIDNLMKGFVDSDVTLTFDYQIKGGAQIVGQQQPISTESDFYLCAMQASSVIQTRPDSQVNAGNVSIRISDDLGYKFSDDYITLPFLTPVAGNPFPFVIKPDHLFKAGSKIWIDIVELSGSLSNVQIVFRGRRRYRTQVQEF